MATGRDEMEGLLEVDAAFLETASVSRAFVSALSGRDLPIR